MLKTILNPFVGVILLIAAQACAPSIPATSDPGVIDTAVAQTFAAAMTQTRQPGIPETGDESPTPTPTQTAIVLASATPTETAVPPTITPAVSSTPVLTPGVVQLYVTVPTNCRTGPSVSYPRVGGLQLDQVANVVGRNATGDYWIIRNPSRASETCWLWGRYATVAGDTSALPVFTPPPLPTPVPGFDASFEGMESCADTGNWWLDLALENTGGITFQSFFMVVTDTVTGVNLTLYQDNFIDRDGCNVEEDQGDLDPGDTLIVSAPSFAYDPTGHRMRARITVCSNVGQNGTCLTQSDDFTP
jgi:hypothetical protein